MSDEQVVLKDVLLEEQKRIGLPLPMNYARHLIQNKTGMSMDCAEAEINLLIKNGDVIRDGNDFIKAIKSD